MQDYEYDTDDEYDLRKSSISDAGFLALEALVIIHGKNLDDSPLSLVQSTQKTLQLHEWIAEKSHKYKIESNFEQLALIETYNNNDIQREPSTLHPHILKNISEAATLLGRYLDWLSQFTELGALMQRSYQDIEERAAASGNPDEYKVMKDYLSRTPDASWQRLRESLAANSPLIAEVADAAEKIAIGVERTKGKPVKNFRNETYPKWHKKLCQILNISGGKSITISRIIWNHHFDKLKIMEDDAARKVIAKYKKFSNGN